VSFEVVASENFIRELKKLSKKYASLKEEIEELGKSLSANPEQGKALGKNCYKIRLSIKSKGKGKSGGARVITCIFLVQEVAVLLSIYDKSEKENIETKELERLINSIGPN
jgi:mRNA-degrading endonuclease RelE of RelBE toxin-antitoxin system